MPPVMTSTSSKNTKKLIVRTSLAIAAIVFAAIIVLAWRWPFSRAAVLKELGDASMSRVQVGAFHGTYFPRPGCVLERVRFQHNPKPGTPPLITAERIRIEGSFSGLFTKQVKLIRVDGLRIMPPPRGTDEHFQAPERSTIVVGDLIAAGAVLEVPRKEKPALTFSF